MEVGNMLACLENNKNCKRSQKVTLQRSEEGQIKIKSHFRIAYRKPKKQFIARKFYNPKEYMYMLEMRNHIRRREANNIKCTDPTIRKRMAPTERNRKDLIRKSLKYSRFR